MQKNWYNAIDLLIYMRSILPLVQSKMVRVLNAVDGAKGGCLRCSIISLVSNYLKILASTWLGSSSAGSNG